MGQILAWADDFHRRNGVWPRLTSGPVAPRHSEKWSYIDYALKRGRRGLPGGSSLMQVLRQHRQVCHGDKRPLSEDLIFQWAQRHFRQTGMWPKAVDGPIPGSDGETWDNINHALIRGSRGLTGRSSLKKLLVGRQAVPPGIHQPLRRPEMPLERIWKWARAHHRRHDEWPGRDSGAIPGSDRETWAKVDAALNGGFRGLPDGSTLLTFLASRGVDARKVQLLTPGRFWPGPTSSTRNTATGRMEIRGTSPAATANPGARSIARCERGCAACRAARHSQPF